jgi:hypothetical protein
MVGAEPQSTPTSPGDGSGRPEVVVSISRLEVLNLLKQELAFLERGGYGGTMPWRPVSMFLDSPSTLSR